MSDPVSELVERFRRGEKRALARAISWVEDRDPRALALAEALGRVQEEAWIVGITGPPGVGKSSLVNQLAGEYLDQGRKVAVLAVDPTSPFSGGAVLGDRIRMLRAVTHPSAFVRSTGTRGALGGLARTTPGVLRMMTLFGFDLILVETVGVGQSEVEIVGAADTRVVTEAPGLGDSVQAIKAGVLEIGDVFVVNKADRPGANRAVLEIEAMLSLAPEGRDWDPPVLTTVSTRGEGVEALMEGLETHRQHLEASGELARRRQARREAYFWRELSVRLRLEAEASLGAEEAGRRMLEAVRDGSLDPEVAGGRVAVDFRLSEDAAPDAARGG